MKAIAFSHSDTTETREVRLSMPIEYWHCAALGRPEDNPFTVTRKGGTVYASSVVIKYSRVIAGSEQNPIRDWEFVSATVVGEFYEPDLTHGEWNDEAGSWEMVRGSWDQTTALFWGHGMSCSPRPEWLKTLIETHRPK